MLKKIQTMRNINIKKNIISYIQGLVKDYKIQYNWFKYMMVATKQLNLNWPTLYKQKTKIHILKYTYLNVNKNDWICSTIFTSIECYGKISSVTDKVNLHMASRIVRAKYTVSTTSQKNPFS